MGENRISGKPHEKPGRKKGTANKKWNKKDGNLRNNPIFFRASSGLVECIAAMRADCPGVPMSTADIIHEAVKEYMYRHARRIPVDTIADIESRM